MKPELKENRKKKYQVIQCLNMLQHAVANAATATVPVTNTTTTAGQLRTLYTVIPLLFRFII